MASSAAAKDPEMETTRTPLISLYSISWSDVPDHLQKLKGFVFVIEALGKDADRKGAQWRYFGGDGGRIDKELEEMSGMEGLKTLLRASL